jgi:uncharacterized membrane protein
MNKDDYDRFLAMFDYGWFLAMFGTFGVLIISMVIGIFNILLAQIFFIISILVVGFIVLLPDKEYECETKCHSPLVVKIGEVEQSSLCAKTENEN